MMEKYIASICIACYNVERYLDGLFENISKMELIDQIQFILIDDGSKDKTFQKILDNIKKYQLEKNTIAQTQTHQGISNVRNKMIKLAQGEYIFFLDGDDRIATDAIKNLYNVAKSKNKDIVTSRAHVIINKKYNLPFIVQYRYVRNMTSNHYVKSNLCTPWGTLFKKSVFDNYAFLEKYNYEDIGLLNFIFLNNNNFTYIKAITYYYYRHENSLSTFNSYNRWNVIDLYEQVNYAFSLYNSKQWFQNKQKLRYINGTFFQILISIYWLSRHYTNNKYINTLPVLAVLSLFKKYNLKLKYSKTFWKSLSYFYIKLHIFSFEHNIKLKNKINHKLKIVNSLEDFQKLDLKDNDIIYLKNDFKFDFDQFKQITFFSLNDYQKPNVFKGLKPILIDEKLIANDQIYFIDLSDFKELNKKQIDIINKINKRILVFLDTKLNRFFDSTQFNLIFLES